MFLGLISHFKHRICKPAAEGFVVLELLEELRIIFEERGDDTLQCLVVLDLSILPVGVLLRVLILLVGRHLLGDFAGDALLHALRIRKQPSIHVVELLHDIGQLVDLHLGLTAAAPDVPGADLCIGE